MPCLVVQTDRDHLPQGHWRGAGRLDCHCVGGNSTGSHGSKAEMLGALQGPGWGHMPKVYLLQNASVPSPAPPVGEHSQGPLSESSRTKLQSIPERVLQTPATESCVLL